ncbi:hypothetical protein RRG08_009422 [Elysia crispata]|uniref:Uncharacterized protein n=1 Tax=Elysia crispata TaxID=231223 RepID=A0AAE1CUG3_9GAST|nr:hypothetical protein RRG08_009422 [Elysia crispata]
MRAQRPKSVNRKDEKWQQNENQARDITSPSGSQTKTAHGVILHPQIGSIASITMIQDVYSSVTAVAPHPTGVSLTEKNRNLIAISRTERPASPHPRKPTLIGFE